MSATPLRDMFQQYVYSLTIHPEIYSDQTVLAMKFVPIILLSLLMSACDNSTATIPPAEPVAAEDAIASFNFRNGYMREQLFIEAEKRGVEIWVNEDGSIGHFVADNRKIDDIFTYIRAVIWVNN